jgi:HAD superfamily hydrolase (TIGR01459 family)
MKMIKPIVNISRVIDEYDTIVVGFRGVLGDGLHIKQEALSALIQLKKQGKRIVLVTNSPMRVVTLAKYLQAKKVPVALFDSIATAGEIMHYKLKYPKDALKALGTTFYNIGKTTDFGVFSGLDYIKVKDIAKSDFLYVSGVNDAHDTIDKYLSMLEHAASLNIPFVCCGNDTSTFMDGQISLSAGALAEQYAVLGGTIITLGKPDITILEYALDGIENLTQEGTILLGDSLTTDIKSANTLGIASILISKGIHVNFLGEGYIPDIARTRDLATNFDAYPDFVISNVRW